MSLKTSGSTWGRRPARDLEPQERRVEAQGRTRRRARRDQQAAAARAHHRLGLSIALAKVNTEGRRVADVVYVTDPRGAGSAGGDRGAKVDANRFPAIREQLVAAIEGKA